ncbi:hypothetical protein CC99x_011210 [Candidatus Berkiella cookevillensis]|uniref:Uncharacterized protein n=1 Tax=Candidatus Berkiella cookevillensis TaxID=437022 RepID=A0A0Q9YPC8_9GAMM|nr:hypothetical protein [Candidatus Berkiella cookevillensis]MCS5709463.1 hypothetical protein [Candidatus Berkiella cookevillensis]
MQSGPTTPKPSTQAVTLPQSGAAAKQQQQPAAQQSPFQMMKNELSGRDLFGILGVVLKSALAALVQAVGIASLLTMGWAINDTVLGRVIVPGFFNAFMGIFANLLPAALAPHATLICVGSMVAIFAFPIVCELLDKLFPEEKAKPKRNTVEGHSLVDTIYVVGAWIIPTIWFAVRVSQGMTVYNNLLGTVGLSALVGGGVGLIKNGQEYMNHLMMRVTKRMMTPVAQPNDAVEPATSPIPGVSNNHSASPIVSTSESQKNILPHYEAKRSDSKAATRPATQKDIIPTNIGKPSNKHGGISSTEEPQVRRSSRLSKPK